MNTTAKITIVVILIFAVAIAVAIKRNNKTDLESWVGSNDVHNVILNETSSFADKTAEPNGIPRLVDLGADKCIPCKMMAPTLKELKKEYAGIFNVTFIDVFMDSNTARKLGIRVIPTQIFLDASGKELYRHEGFFSKKSILATWERLGVNIEKIQE
jgi:thioredoxin 1